MIVPSVTRLQLFRAAVQRSRDAMVNTSIFTAQRDIPSPAPDQYVLFQGGAGLLSSAGMRGEWEVLNWFVSAMCVAISPDGCLDVAERLDQALIGFDCAPDLPGIGLIYPDQVDAPMIDSSGRVEGDSRQTITRFYRLSADRG